MTVEVHSSTFLGCDERSARHILCELRVDPDRIAPRPQTSREAGSKMEAKNRRIGALQRPRGPSHVDDEVHTGAE